MEWICTPQRDVEGIRYQIFGVIFQAGKERSRCRRGEGRGGVWRNRSRSSWGLSLSVCLSLSLRVCVEGQQAGYGFPISCLAIKIQGTSRATHGSSLEIHKRDPASKFIHLDGEAHQ